MLPGFIVNSRHIFSWANYHAPRSDNKQTNKGGNFVTREKFCALRNKTLLCDLSSAHSLSGFIYCTVRFV